MRRAHWGGPGEDYRLKKLSATAIGEASSIGSPAPDELLPCGSHRRLSIPSPGLKSS